MTKQVSVQLIDDLDGGEASETVRFALDGTGYEIDLSAANADKFRSMLAGYVTHARKIGGSGALSRTRTPRAQPNPENEVVRKWALAAGHEINGHGRIPAHIRRMYEAARATD